MLTNLPIETWQWIILILINVGLFLVSPWSRHLPDFFKGSHNDRAPNVFLLTSSLVICWLFAKSITNAIDLGYNFGFVGGVAYAGYYFSFLVAGIYIYRMRTIGGFTSIHQFLRLKFGSTAVHLFSLLITFRLLNEIWSNTMIVGSYFGATGSIPYYLALFVFTLLTLAYTLKGGMRSSIMTDVIQMALFGILITVVLLMIFPKTDGGIHTYVTSGKWEMSSGLNLFYVALIQVFSYPWHDPIMTDRGFISNPKTTLTAFIWATIIGIICILMASMIGIFGSLQGVTAPASMEVAKLLGLPMMLIMNVIMITSAASTIDSTFTSAAKLVHIDILESKGLTVNKARITMTILAVIGTIPVFFNPEILSATTVSGTMVLGLAPIFVCWRLKAPRISYFLSVIAGIIFGLIFIFVPIPKVLLFSDGKYADLLSINIFATFICFIVFLIPYWYNKYVRNY